VGQPAGKFGWIDVAVPDQEVGKKFYTDLFGWEAKDEPLPDGASYTMFHKGGKLIAGLGTTQQGMPPAWTSYVMVDSADEAISKVGGLGGRVLMPAMDVMDAGRMAILADPTGAVFGIWQSGAHKGADLLDQHGALTWMELATRGVDKALPFYTGLFGWEWKEQDMGGNMYHTAHLGESQTSGAMEMGPQWPAEVPPHWDVYIQVDKLDSAVKKLKKLGGKVLTEQVVDVPGVGRLHMVADPGGATFYMMEPARQS
jgi:predicted enzyme related to lactoylglutathione lyase